MLLPFDQRVIDALPGGLVRVDGCGAVLTANREAMRILGLGYDELTGRYSVDFAGETLHEDGSPCSVEDYPVTRALTTGEPQPPTTIGVRRPDGGISWAVFTAVPVGDDDGGGPAGAVVTFLDITERKEMEERLRRSEAYLRSILQHAPNIILVTDREGHIQFVNRGHADLRPPNVIGVSVLDFVAERDRGFVASVLSRVIERGETVSYELGARDDVPGWFAVTAGPVRESGAITAMVMIAQDVSEHKKLQARVMEHDRMAALGTVAAGVAHEINNPLTYVMASIDSIVSELRDSSHPLLPRLGRRLEAALEGAERISQVVRDLTTFSHPHDRTRDGADLHEVIESSIRMAMSELRHRTRLVRDLEWVPPVVGSPSRIGQVFLNLLINAAQAMSEDDAARNEIVVRTRRRADAVVAEVRDTGCGIAPELLPNIFDAFVTSKAPGQGTGLGLYICRNIVAELGGTLTCESEPGGGSVFRVVLPIAGGDATTAPPQDALATARHAVLVADDEPAIRRLLREALRDHEVVEAESGREAIAAIDARADFALVFCDLMMPDGPGMAVYEHARATRPALAERFVFMTGAVSATGVRAFLAEAQCPVLRKPFRAPDVARLVRITLGSSRAG